MTELSHSELVEIIETSAWVPKGDRWKTKLNDLSKKLREVSS